MSYHFTLFCRLTPAAFDRDWPPGLDGPTRDRQAGSNAPVNRHPRRLAAGTWFNCYDGKRLLSKGKTQ